ncbi:sperm acrosome membrane-associated protein 4-like [Antennarius striatus]|uniref:sperm acrosome membrane-associated protein 4-like n=1 Tax=Antennarius striatus TaxID=241820 RepID=UPI0035AD7F85
MNKLLLSCAAFLTLFVTVESLTCRSCEVSVLGSCLFTDHVNCTAQQNSCFDAVTEFSGHLLPIYSRGCIEDSMCRNETNQPILTITYNVTIHCCSTDLCNSAASFKLPLAAVLAAALVALWSQKSL